MSKGISLHIGINSVDDTHYRTSIFAADGWNGALKGCEIDATALEQLAQSRGFKTRKLLTKEATRKNVVAEIERAATNLEKGDYFFLTYSGHGSQVRDLSGDEKQDAHVALADRRDETWCLYDAQLLDDELYGLWSKFEDGVRILVISDSCHSGTVTRGGIDGSSLIPPEGMAYRFMPKAGMTATYKSHKAFYDQLQSKTSKRSRIKARVLLFSGCQDFEMSREDQSSEQPGGLFTKSILSAWKSEAYSNYADFFRAVKNNMPDEKQAPNYYAFGEEGVSFEQEAPFVI
ncbi:MAG: caspase family protein [Saprospiraceae bacterium]